MKKNKNCTIPLALTLEYRQARYYGNRVEIDFATPARRGGLSEIVK